MSALLKNFATEQDWLAGVAGFELEHAISKNAL